MTAEKELAHLQRVVERLRDPADGCRWDLDQDSRSLAPYLLEEAHEAAQAIDREDHAATCEELGDILINVFLQASIAAEHERFDLAAVARAATEKIVQRHPHVFSPDGSRPDEKVLARRWVENKSRTKEGVAKGGILRTLPPTLSAWLRAVRLGEDAAAVGFDWPDASGPWRKVSEELQELQRAMVGEGAERTEEELGDLLLALSSLSRHLAIDAERALERAMERFRERFGRMEQSGRALSECKLEELEELWQRAKRRDQP